MFKSIVALLALSSSLPVSTDPSSAEFVSAMSQMNFAAARKISGEIATLNDDAASDLGRKTLPFDAIIAWTKGCKASPAMSKQYDGFYDLWWNCGVSFRSDGEKWRTMVRVFVIPNGEKVVLKNLMKPNFPDRTSSPALQRE